MWAHLFWLFGWLFFILEVKAVLAAFEGVSFLICRPTALPINCSSWGSFSLLGNQVEPSCLQLWEATLQEHWLISLSDYLSVYSCLLTQRRFHTGLSLFFLAKVVRQPSCSSAMEFKSWLWSLKLYTVFMVSLEERCHREESFFFGGENSYLQTLCEILPKEAFLGLDFKISI